MGSVPQPDVEADLVRPAEADGGEGGQGVAEVAGIELEHFSLSLYQNSLVLSKPETDGSQDGQGVAEVAGVELEHGLCLLGKEMLV